MSRHGTVTRAITIYNDFNILLVEAPGVEARREEVKSHNLAQLRAQLGERVLAIFRENPRMLVQVVTHVTASLGAGGRADVHAVCVLLDEILSRVERDAEAGEEAG